MTSLKLNFFFVAQALTSSPLLRSSCRGINSYFLPMEQKDHRFPQLCDLSFGIVGRHWTQSHLRHLSQVGVLVWKFCELKSNNYAAPDALRQFRKIKISFCTLLKSKVLNESCTENFPILEKMLRNPLISLWYVQTEKYIWTRNSVIEKSIKLSTDIETNQFFSFWVLEK